MSRPGDEEAAIARRCIEVEQKKTANNHLMHLRSLIDVSQDGSAHDAFMADGLLRAIADDEHPSWERYDPRAAGERIHRYPLDASHRELIPMINGIYTSVAAYMNKIVSNQQIDVEETKKLLADITGNALVASTRTWSFGIGDYRDLTFVAHQMLVADSTNVKLFIVTVNATIPIDYFFYFF